MDWPSSWHNEWATLWNEIALQECLQYLDVCLNEHGLILNPGDKTKLTFKSALTHFSVSQIYNMIWRASKDAAAFYVRKRVSKQHAANTVVGNIQRNVERAISENWDIKKYGRDRRCPRTMVSQVLFDAVLQIGTDGFNEIPAKRE